MECLYNDECWHIAVELRLNSELFLPPYVTQYIGSHAVLLPTKFSRCGSYNAECS